MSKVRIVSFAILLAWPSHSPLPFPKRQAPEVAQPTDQSSQLNSPIQQIEIRPFGESTIRRTLDKKTIEISIYTVRVKKTDAGFPPDLESYNEVSLVQSIQVIVGGHSVVVPRSAFKDLFDVRTARLASENGLFVLSFGGGDGAEVYVARIFFDSKAVHRRALFAANNQKLPVEETHYRTKVTIIE